MPWTPDATLLRWWQDWLEPWTLEADSTYFCLYRFKGRYYVILRLPERTLVGRRIMQGHHIVTDCSTRDEGLRRLAVAQAEMDQRFARDTARQGIG